MNPRITNYGAGSGPAIVGRNARGTENAPTATQSGDPLMGMSGWGYGTTGWAGQRKAILELCASENWTDETQGTHFTLSLTTRTARSEVVRVLGNGFFGIGMIPAKIFDVTQSVNSLSTLRLTNGNTGNAASAGLTLVSNTGNLTISHNGSGYTGTNYGLANSSQTLIESDSNSGLVIAEYNAKPLVLGTNHLERLTINSTGEVGIGMTATSKLHIKGSGTTSATNSLTVINSNSVNLFNVRDDGNVSINQATPTSKLHLQGSFAVAISSVISDGITVGVNDSVVIASGTCSVNLPAANTCAGRIYEIKDVGTGVITLTPAGADLIDKVATYPINIELKAIKVISDGVSAWWVL
jgi:hypothetical protein